MKPGISIVLCTFNGAKRLPETLKHIAQQEVRNDVPWEVIVVDNASTDNTHQVIEEEWAKYNTSVPFSLLHQSRQGLTYAREMAFNASGYDFILMCDDDNWLAQDYVNIAYDLMVENPSIGVLGGCGELEYEVEPPYYAKALPLFANGAQAKSSGKVSRNFVYGAGSVIRKSAYFSILDAGFKPLLTDRVGANLSSGGDFEICFALVLAGFDIWYDDRLKFKHFMEEQRLSWDYYIRFFKESSTCFEVLDPYVFITTYGSSNLISFNSRYLHGIFYYLWEMVRLYKSNYRTPMHSEEKNVITLKIFACRQRLSGYRQYNEMKRVFLNILKLKKNYLGPLKSRRVQGGNEVSSSELSAGLL